MTRSKTTSPKSIDDLLAEIKKLKFKEREVDDQIRELKAEQNTILQQIQNLNSDIDEAMAH